MPLRHLPALPAGAIGYYIQRTFYTRAQYDELRAASWLVTRDPVPMSLWGRDHWSTLAYLESVAVNQRGAIDNRRMRCDVDRHPGQAHRYLESKTKYPTRLRHGLALSSHDDWDCVDDMIAAGLVVNEGTGLNPIIRMTERGYALASALRVALAERSLGPSASVYDSFTPPEAEPPTPEVPGMQLGAVVGGHAEPLGGQRGRRAHRARNGHRAGQR